jgi:hypothetical protein
MAASVLRSRLLEAATEATRELVGVQERADGVYVTLPLTYPSGASVVIRVDGTDERFFVSDFGMGYLEADLMGAGSLFSRHARPIAEAGGVGFDQRAFFVVEVGRDHIAGAISAVAACSHEAVVISAHKLTEKTSRDQAIVLYERLVRVFPRSSVERDPEIVGSTNTVWHVASLVRVGKRNTIFDVVTKHPVSVTTASTKFHDIARLERPPNRVAVVSDKNEFGTYLGVLSMDANVIEHSAPDQTYIKLAEAA